MPTASLCVENHLAPVLAAIILQLSGERASRLKQVGELQADVDTTRLLLKVALELIADMNRKVTRAGQINAHLRAQLRAVFSGLTAIEERQLLDSKKAADEWKRVAA